MSKGSPLGPVAGCPPPHTKKRTGLKITCCGFSICPHSDCYFLVRESAGLGNKVARSKDRTLLDHWEVYLDKRHVISYHSWLPLLARSGKGRGRVHDNKEEGQGDGCLDVYDDGLVLCPLPKGEKRLSRTPSSVVGVPGNHGREIT